MDGEQEQYKRTELLKLWHECGKTYNVFVPKEQPDPRRTPVKAKEQALLLFRLFL